MKNDKGILVINPDFLNSYIGESGYNFQDMWNQSFSRKEKYDLLSEKLQDKGYSYPQVFEFLRTRGYQHFAIQEDNSFNHRILDQALIESDFIRPDFSEKIYIFNMPRRIGYTHFLKNMNEFLETGQAENLIQE